MARVKGRSYNWLRVRAPGIRDIYAAHNRRVTRIRPATNVMQSPGALCVSHDSRTRARTFISRRRLIRSLAETRDVPVLRAKR